MTSSTPPVTRSRSVRRFEYDIISQPDRPRAIKVLVLSDATD